MKKALTITTIAAGLSLFGWSARAQDYVVNGHAASKTEARLLASYSAPPGHWLIDGYGISSAKTEQPTLTNHSRKCWYVLDVLLCDDKTASTK